MGLAVLERSTINSRTTYGQGKMDFYEETFPTPASRLAFLLKNKGIKQKELAEELGISAPYLSTIVSGDKKNLQPESWLKIAEVFGVTLDWLLCRKGAPMNWVTDVDEQPVSRNRQADEVMRIMADMPPRKRDEMLGVLRAMSFSVQQADLDADKTTKMLADSLAVAGLVLSPKALEAIRSTLFAFAMGMSSSDRD